MWPYGIHLFDLKAGGQLWSGWNLSSPLWPGGWRIETPTADYVKDVFFFQLANGVQAVFACFSSCDFQNEDDHQIQADSMTMAGEEEGTREVRFEPCEHFFYLWDLFRCAPPRTLFTSISQSQRPTMVEQLGFSFLGNMTRYWQHALYKFNFIRSLIIDVSLGGTLPQDHKNLFPGHPWHQASPRLRPSFPTKRNASRWTW